MDWIKIKKDIFLAFSSHFFYKVIGYFTLMILTRYLTKDEMGEFFFASALATFFTLFTELGMNTHLLREIAKTPENASNYFSEVVSIRIPLFTIYFILLNGFAFVFKPKLILIIFLTSIYVFFEELYQSFGAAFLGLKKVKYNVISGVTTKLLLIALILVVVLFKGGLTTILIGFILANTFLVGIAYIIFSRKIDSPKFIWSRDSALRIFRISFPLFLLSVLGIIHFKVDTLMLGFMKSYNVVATYEAAYKLLEASRFIILPIGMVFLPLISEMATNQKWSDIHLMSKKILFVTGAIGVGIAIVVVTGAGIIIPMVFGGKYNDSIVILRILFLSVPMLYMAAVSSFFVRSIHLERRAVKIMLTCVIINIILNIFFIQIWGAIGAACTTVITETILAVLLIILNFQELQARCSKETVNKLENTLDHVR